MRDSLQKEINETNMKYNGACIQCMRILPGYNWDLMKQI